LIQAVEGVLQEADLLAFLKANVQGGLKFHHEFRVTLADCPNACSQPQIRDIGLIGACAPVLTEQPCTQCEACVDECREDAIVVDASGPQIDGARCLACGKCVAACDSGTLATGIKGFRVQVGGKLGRHPQLARELPGIYNEDEVREIVQWCLDFYKQHSRNGQRLAEVLTDADFERMVQKMGSRAC
jgi:dissimilatory sulfite reductase (desulfoviridin) alpha/beta subunit